MARNKGPKGKKIPRGPPRLPTLDIEAKEVAARELSTALQLLMSGGDPIAVHLLTMAAFDVCEREAKRQKRSSAWTRQLERIEPHYMDDYLEVMRGPYRSMKHGGPLRNFMPDAVHLHLLLAMSSFWACYDEVPPGLGSLQLWIQANIPREQQPEYLHDGREWNFEKRGSRPID